MGYRIHYKSVRVPRKRNYFHSGILMLSGLFFALFALFTYLYWPAGYQILTALLHNSFEDACRLFASFSERVQGIKALDFLS